MPGAPDHSTRPTFAELIDGLEPSYEASLRVDASAAPLTDLTDDSRRVTPGACFVARETGDERWKDYVVSAVERGAAAVVAPGPVDVPPGVALAVLPAVDQQAAGRLAARFFGHPADRLRLIGVTGTNGKTTVATLTRHLLNAAGVKCGLLGTIYIDAGSPNGPTPAELTTPGGHRPAPLLCRDGEQRLRRLCDGGVQPRTRPRPRRWAAFRRRGVHQPDPGTTSITTARWTAYAAAKAKLFASLDAKATAVLNADDPASLRMVKDSAARRVWTAVTANENSAATDKPLRIEPGPGEARLELLTAEVLQATATRCEVMLRHGLGEARLGLPLVGRHNVSNWLQAVAAAVAAGGRLGRLGRGVRRPARRARPARTGPRRAARRAARHSGARRAGGLRAHPPTRWRTC